MSYTLTEVGGSGDYRIAMNTAVGHVDELIYSYYAKVSKYIHSLDRFIF